MPEIDLSAFQIDPWLIAIVVIVLIAFIALTVNRGIRVHRQQTSTGREELVGKTATVMRALTPEGIVFFRGERWQAVAEEGKMRVGEEVVINKVENLKLYVTKKP